MGQMGQAYWEDFITRGFDIYQVVNFIKDAIEHEKSAFQSNKECRGCHTGKTSIDRCVDCLERDYRNFENRLPKWAR